MKAKQLCLFLFATLVSLVCFTPDVNAADIPHIYIKTVRVDDMYFKIYKDETAVFTRENAVDIVYSGNMVIPSTIEYEYNSQTRTYTVIGIDEKAFFEAADLESVTIPNTVTSIGKLAFAYSGLKSIAIPGSVTSIGAGAFFHSELYDKSSNWYDDVLYIGDCLIEVKPKVKQLIVREGTRLIGDNCCVVHMEYSGNVPERKTEYLYLPNTVQYIGKGAFNDCELIATVYMSNAIKRIEDYAFRFCPIKKIDLPNTLEYIGDYAFSGCDFETINLANSIEYIGNYAISGTYLKEVTLPENEKFTTINKHVFAGCSSLETVTIPKTVTHIDEYAFLNCKSLKDIYCKGKTLQINKNVTFENVDVAKITLHIKERYWSHYSKNWPGFKYSDERFSQDGIYYSLNAEKRTGAVAKEKNGTDNYSALTSNIVIPKTVADGYETFDVTGLDKGAFAYAPITQITIESPITEVSVEAFFSAKQLTKASLPKTVIKINDKAFEDCEALNFIPALTNEYPEYMPNLSSIGASAFAQCSSLSKLRLRTVTTIGERAFYNCSGLKDVVLGSSVASIGEQAFAGCTSLETVTNLADTPQPFPAGLFDGVNKDQFVIYVHRNACLAFEAADGWGDYNIQIIPSEIQYAVYLKVNDENAGTVSGAGLYSPGTEVTVTATPKEGYRFVRWSNGKTKASFSFTLNSNVMLYAVFEEDVVRYYYDLNLQSGDETLGTVSGGGTHIEEGTVVDITATPKSGCEFQYWTDSKGTYWGKIAQWTVSADETLTAHFRVKPDYDEYLVYVLGERVTSSNANDILGDGVWSYDRATHTLSTMKDATYKKENVEFIEDWETKLGDLTVRVNHQITVEVTSTDETMRTAMLSATNGMKIIGAKNQGIWLTVHNMRPIQMSKTLTLENHVRLSVTLDNTTEFGKTNFDKIMWLTGTPALRVNSAWAQFYAFNNGKVSNVTDAKLELVNAEAAGSMDDTYMEIHDLTPVYDVTYQTEEAMNMCYVSGMGSFYEGEQVTLRALPATSYEFVRWSDGTTDNPYTFIMPAHDVLIDPIVQGEDINPDGAIINAYAPVGQGHIGDDFVGGWFASGTVVTITAVSEEGYNFVKWDDGNTDNPRIITAEAGKNMSLLAEFEQRERFTVTFLDWDDEVLSVEKVYKGDDAQVPQTPVRQGYSFNGWRWQEREILIYGTTVPNIRENATFKAQFNINTYIVRFFDIDGMQIGEDQMIEYGGAAVAPDAPEVEGYTFLRWNQFFNYVESDLDIYALYEQNQSEGIEDIRVEDNQTRKVMMDGVLYILRGDKIYTIQGAEVK